MHLQSILIVGYGLMGASIVECFPDAKISVHDVIPIEKHGILYYHNIKQALAVKYDAIILASSIDLAAIDYIVSEIQSSINHDAFIVDVWSLKSFTTKYTSILPNFYPSHPIAGSHKSGWQHASAEMLFGKNVIVTKDGKPVREFWSACKMNPILMESALHDVIFAEVSHFPQLLSFLLAKAGDDVSQGYMRLAHSNYDMWQTIFGLNKNNIDNIFRRFISLFETIEVSENGSEVSEVVGYICKNITNHTEYAGSGFQTITMHAAKFCGKVNHKAHAIINCATKLHY